MSEDSQKKEQRPDVIPKSSIIDPFDTDASSKKNSKKGDVNKVEPSAEQSEAKSALQQAIESLSKKEKQSHNSYNELLRVAPMLFVTGLLLFSIAFATSYKSVGNIVTYAGSQFIDKTDELIEYTSLAAVFGISSLIDSTRAVHRNELAYPASKGMVVKQAGKPIAHQRIKILPSSFSLDVLASIVQKQMAAVSESMRLLFITK